MSGPPPVAILGPTASGKSELAMAAARAVGGVELVVVDAMQVYRGMDVGTAKPSLAERAQVPHHCLDLADPYETFTVARFQRACDAALGTIGDRGSRALLVAGTGLYLRAVVDRLTLPGEWPEVRRELEAEPDAEVLHHRLAGLDALAAERIEPGNRRRTLRALEVCLGSGHPFSSFGPGLDHYPATDVRLLGLRWPRALLAERIAVRVRLMVDAGLVEEVKALAERPGGLSRTARQALGYKEILEHLEGRCSLDEAIGTVVTRTRQLAVRQDRWFRRDPRVRWLDIDHDPLDALPAVLAALARCS